MDPEIIGALIGPLLTAALAALAVGFKEWRRRRETADQRHETLQQATDEVAFIDAWITAEAPPGYPAWADHSYPGPLPNSPGQVGAGYPPPE